MTILDAMALERDPEGMALLRAVLGPARGAAPRHPPGPCRGRPEAKRRRRPATKARPHLYEA